MAPSPKKYALPLLAVGWFFLSPLGALAVFVTPDQKTLADAFALFKKGAYAQSVELAESIHTADTETSGSIAFFVATALSKMQTYDKAIERYAQAEALGHKAPSLHFDYGQALFASQRLKEALTEFRRSIIAKFKLGASAYYIAYIQQLLENKAGAKDFYQRIQKLSVDIDSVKQASLLQVAEMAHEDADALKEQKDKKKERRRLLEGEVLALYRRARSLGPDTPIGLQAKEKIEEIEIELDLLVDRMRNGNPYPRQLYTLALSQDFTYDSNVITQADQALVQVTNRDAVVWKTGILGKYQFNWRNVWSFIPEMNASLTLNSRRSTPEVYQNDSISLTPALRTKMEHWSNGFPATMLFEVEYNKTLRDNSQNHQFPYYISYWNFILGERVRWLKIGSTTLKAAIKFLENYQEARNEYNPSISATQLVKIMRSFNLVNTLSADYVHARDDFNDERNYRLRTSVTFVHFFEKVDFTPTLALAVKDTMKQKGTRGNEKTFNPSIAFNREFGHATDATLEYIFTKNYSLQKDTYQYTKHEAHFGLGYHF